MYPWIIDTSLSGQIQGNILRQVEDDYNYNPMLLLVIPTSWAYTVVLEFKG